MNLTNHRFRDLKKLYVSGCIACMGVCVPPICLTVPEARRGHCVLDWSYTWLWLPCGYWLWNYGSLREQPALKCWTVSLAPPFSAQGYIWAFNLMAFYYYFPQTFFSSLSPISLCSPHYFRTHNPPASVPWVLGLQTYYTFRFY